MSEAKLVRYLYIERIPGAIVEEYSNGSQIIEWPNGRRTSAPTGVVIDRQTLQSLRLAR